MPAAPTEPRREGRSAAPLPALLLIGVHREELDFGRAVAQALGADVGVLEIPDGLSGRRPLPGETHRYDTLHQALYQQLLPHVRGHYRLLIDLHTGRDRQGPSADLLCASAALREALRRAIAGDEGLAGADIRLIPLGDAEPVHARTVIPEQIWRNAAFDYLGLEIYLPDGPAGQRTAVELAARLVRRAVTASRVVASAAG